ncbi:hypothetical protein QJS04_geneDACA001326 [Acorus gramineus]|uniref:Late embryogenesis abundant protein LEA-2 subgroup domain-containing protein n=1 Tax=Acorus gramineus TaxID=55184 RepID=A0AAV9ABS7_ACOGR|nr:hypothetical protein QJS04_geneDACA001326 [Acorus gramineus]
MHTKSESEVTSLAASSPPCPLYYVDSPSPFDSAERIFSYLSSPAGSPPPYFHHHHSRDSSSASRFSASIKYPIGRGGWRKMRLGMDDEEERDDDDDDDNDEGGSGMSKRAFYGWCFVIMFFVLLMLFSLILFGAGRAFKPNIRVKSVVFENYNIQPGTDRTGVPSLMISINSTVKMTFRNPATFFGVHVTSTPLSLCFYDLPIASGYMEKFYQSRKSERLVTVKIGAKEMPVYGGGASLTRKGEEPNSVPFNLTFVVRSRAYVLGMLVKPKFYRRVQCLVVLKKNRLGESSDLKEDSCTYHD